MLTYEWSGKHTRQRPEFNLLDEQRHSHKVTFSGVCCWILLRGPYAPYISFPLAETPNSDTVQEGDIVIRLWESLAVSDNSFQLSYLQHLKDFCLRPVDVVSWSEKLEAGLGRGASCRIADGGPWARSAQRVPSVGSSEQPCSCVDQVAKVA